MPLMIPDNTFNTPAPQPDPRQIEAHDCLDALLEISHGLSDWECDFVDNLADWKSDFTEPQIDKILEIYDRNF